MLVPLALALAGTVAGSQWWLFLRIAEPAQASGPVYRTIDTAAPPGGLAQTPFTKLDSPDGAKTAVFWAPRRSPTGALADDALGLRRAFPADGVYQVGSPPRRLRRSHLARTSGERLFVLWKHDRVVALILGPSTRDGPTGGLLSYDEPDDRGSFPLRLGLARIRVAADGDHLDVIESDGVHTRLDANLRVVRSQRDRAWSALGAWVVWCGFAAAWLILERRRPAAVEVAVALGTLACCTWIAMAITPWLR